MNNLNQQENNIQQTVLNKIRTGKVHMTPKGYFVLKIIALVLTALALLITSGFLISYMFFSLRVSGQLFLLGFGWRGIKLFIMLFPWGLLLIDVIIILIFEWLLKEFKLFYRYPLMYVFFIFLAVVILLGFIISITSLHDTLLHQEERQPLPLIGRFYNHIRRPLHELGEFRGTVLSIATSSFQFRDDDLATSSPAQTVEVPPQLGVPSFLKVGDRVFVAGDVHGSEIHAFGIRKLMPGDEDPD